MKAIYTVAIDLSKYKHTATIMDTRTSDICETVTIPVNHIGFSQFLTKLTNYSENPCDFAIGCEATGHYGETVLRWLQNHGYTVIRMNPAQVVQFRRGLGQHAKTDQLDAKSMAMQLSITDWLPDQPIQETASQLQCLTRLRLDFIDERSRWINRVRGLVNQLYPELEKHLGKIASPTAVAILTHFPSRLLLAETSIDQLTTVVKTASRGAKGLKYAQTIQQVAQKSVGLDDPWLTTELVLITKQLQSLNQMIKNIEQQIRTFTIQLLSEYSICLKLKKSLTLRSFPCGNYISIGTLLSEIGDIRRFKSLKQLLSYFGWCPNTHDSGTSSVKNPRMSRRGNRFVRRILWMMAITSVRWVPEYRTYFEQRTKQGKNKMKTLVAIGRKLLSVVYAILRSGQPYDAERYLCQPISVLAS